MPACEHLFVRQVLNFNGVSWSLFASPTTRTLRAVSGNTMVGDFGTVVTLHWDGTLILDSYQNIGPRSVCACVCACP